jgi:hypothetical protein
MSHVGKRRPPVVVASAFCAFLIALGGGPGQASAAPPDQPAPTIPVPSGISALRLPVLPMPVGLPPFPYPADVPIVELPSDIPAVQLPSAIPRVELPADVPAVQLPAEVPPIQLPAPIPPGLL